MPERVFWHPRPLAAPVYKSPDYPPLSACSGLSRAGRDQKPSNNRPLPELCEDLARIVAMVRLCPPLEEWRGVAVRNFQPAVTLLHGSGRNPIESGTCGD